MTRARDWLTDPESPRGQQPYYGEWHTVNALGQVNNVLPKALFLVLSVSMR